MSFRKEKKFRLTLSDFQILKFSLFERGMNELYPERKVQSYYYDTKDLKMFEDSDEEGPEISDLEEYDDLITELGAQDQHIFEETEMDPLIIEYI